MWCLWHQILQAIILKKEIWHVEQISLNKAVILIANEQGWLSDWMDQGNNYKK